MAIGMRQRAEEQGEVAMEAIVAKRRICIIQSVVERERDG